MSEDLAALLNNAEPIRDGDTRYDALLDDLQCNVLSGHGRKEARYFFLRFTDVIKARYLCGMLPRSPVERAMVFTAVDSKTAELLPPRTRDALLNRKDPGGPLLLTREDYDSIQGIVLTSEKSNRTRNHSSKAQRSEGARRAADRNDPTDFAVNLLLTRRGYEKLTSEALPSDAAFLAGMAAREKLNDPTRDAWDADLTGVDALLIVAYDPCARGDDRRRQETALETLERGLSEHAGLLGPPQVGRNLTVKLGDISPNQALSDDVRKKDVAIEPFGFRDGISQPAFYQSQLEQLEKKGILPARWEAEEAAAARERAFRAAFAPLGLALCPDPNGKTRHACGSYFVFRKLAQNIETFYTQVGRLAAETGRDQEDVLGDLLGRRRDGTPLAGKEDERTQAFDEAAGINAFDYSDDGEGKRCPFHAHIRKVNPRADLGGHGREQRIVRHGMPYGPEIVRDRTGLPELKNGKIKRRDGAKAGKNDIGLLFLCAQASIEKQFERIQVDWANNPNFAWGKLPGADTIVGQRPEKEQGGKREANRIRMSRKNRDQREYEATFEPVVTLCGGDYFFAPSISFLRSVLDDLWK